MGVKGHRVGGAVNKDKSKADIKNIKVSWQISDYDLENQKKNELVSHLNKGYKISIFLDEKGSNNMNPQVEDVFSNQSPSLPKRIVQRRIDITEKLKSYLSEYGAKYSIKGSEETRIVMKVVPSNTSNDGALDKHAIKEQRKRERQEKLRLRAEKKQQRHLVDL